MVRGEYNDIARSTRPRSAGVTIEYVLRRVDEGDATVTESDDVVSLVKAEHGVPVELIPESALIVNSWYVRTDSTPGGVLQLQSLTGGLGLELMQPVQFVSYEDPERVVQWLRRCNGRIPGFRVSFPGGGPEARSLYIDRVIANTDAIVGPKKRSPDQRLGQ